MTATLDRLASASGQKAQQLNIDLAQEIAGNKDSRALAELLAGLQHKNKALRHDCIKTIYETAALAPALVSPAADELIALLEHKDNRLQWGAMTALSAVVSEIPGRLFETLPRLVAIADKGSVITRDHLVRILTGLAAYPEYASSVRALLLEQLLLAPVNQLPSYAEQTLPAVTGEKSSEEKLRQVLEIRLPEIAQESKRKRIEKVLKKLR